MRILILSFIIFVLGFIGLLNPVRDFFQDVFSPVQVGVREMARDLKEGVKFFSNLKAIRDENLLLLEENQELRSRILEIQIAEEENSALKEQLGLDIWEDFDKELVLANVLGNPLDVTGGSILINRGVSHGIKNGDNVIRGRNLVGIVADVSEKRSLVNLVTSPAVSITVKDVDVYGKTEGLATGQYGTSIEMSRILPIEEVFVGDTIVTSGKDGIFEPNLVVGNVEEVIEGSAEPLKTARLGTSIDVTDLDRVFVVID